MLSFLLLLLMNDCRNSNDVTKIYGEKLIPNLLETIVVDKYEPFY